MKGDGSQYRSWRVCDVAKHQASSVMHPKDQNGYLNVTDQKYFEFVLSD